MSANARSIISYNSCNELLLNEFFSSSYFTNINEKRNVHIAEETFCEFFKDEHNITINTSLLSDCDLSMLKEVKKIVLVFRGDRNEQFKLSYALLKDIQEYGNEDLDVLLGYHNCNEPLVTMIYV